MAVTAKLTESLPKLAVSPEMRARVQAVADKVEVGMSEVVRDCISEALPKFELALGLVDLDELSQDDLEALGLAVLDDEPEKPAPSTDRFTSGWGPDRG